MKRFFLPLSTITVAAAGLGAVGGSVLAVDAVFRRMAQEQAQGRAASAQNVLEAWTEQQGAMLAERAQLFAAQPRLRAAAITPGLADEDLQRLAQGVCEQAGADSAAVYGEEGSRLTSAPGETSFPQSLISKALAGEISHSLEVFGSEVCLVAAAPIASGRSIDGALALAKTLKPEEVSALETLAGVPIVLVSRGGEPRLAPSIRMSAEAGEVRLSGSVSAHLVPSQARVNRWARAVEGIVLALGLALVLLAAAQNWLYVRRRRLFAQGPSADEAGSRYGLRAQEVFWSAFPDPMLIAAEDGAVRSANAAAESLLGYGAGELAGKPLSAVVGDGCAYRKDGNRVSARLWEKSLPGGGRLIVLQDRSEQNAAAALHQSYDRIKENIDRARPGGESGFPAEVERLLGSLVYRVKNSLAVVLQGIDYLKRDAADARQLEVLGVMAETVNQIDAMSLGALQCVAPPALQLRPVQFTEILDEVLEDLHESIAAQKISLLRRFTPDQSLVLLDPEHMKAALLHVCRNAIQAMPGGGKLTAYCTIERLVDVGAGVGARGSDAFVRGQTVFLCEISDTGRGIPAEKQQDIFKPFTAGGPRGEGSGLGLAIARAIVRAHKGRIELESRVGEGTHVRIRLSLAPLPSGPVKKRILLIDDDVAVCRMMKLNLERSGEFAVETAFLGREGLGKALAGDYDLVITDFQMPDINGGEVLRGVKEKKPNLPVLLFSIYHDMNAPITPETKAAADGLLTKPIDHAQLYRAIERVLNRSRRDSG